MTLELAMRLIDLLVQVGVRNVIFIGGEPTLWHPLFQAKEYVKKNGMTASLITNGSHCGTKRFLDAVIHSPFDSITISVKAGNPEQYKDLTGRDAYADVMRGIQNLNDRGMSCQVSITLNSFIVHNLTEVVSRAIDAGAKQISIEFCNPVFGINGSQDFVLTPRETIKCVMNHYSDLDRVTGGKLTIQQSTPFCLWPKDFLDVLIKKGQLMSGCHVMRREGIIFDPSGKLIPCNTLYQCELGQYGIDFKDKNSFLEYMRSEDMKKFYDKLTAYPSRNCIGCEDSDSCGGGCPLSWFILNPEQVIPSRTS